MVYHGLNGNLTISTLLNCAEENAKVFQTNWLKLIWNKLNMSEKVSNKMTTENSNAALHPSDHKELWMLSKLSCFVYIVHNWNDFI